MIEEKLLNYIVKDTSDLKTLRSPKANFNFYKKTGLSIAWGKSFKEDPILYPSNDIMDIEVTVGCKGVRGKICSYCYKCNSLDNIKLMSFDEFKHIIDISPRILSQIAIGADATLELNPDLWKMMKYSRERDIIPNITAADISDEVADKLAQYCGAVAISYHGNKDACYDSIKKLTDRGMTQVNMHYVIMKESLDETFEILNDIKNDPRLKKLNSIVFLSLKTKGRGERFTPLTQKEFDSIVVKAYEEKINIGFDSCSAFKALNIFKRIGVNIEDCVWDCESTLTSFYVNVNSQAFPCSFTEGTEGWEEGIDLKEINSPEEYITKVWHNERIEEFRKKLLETSKCGSCRTCPIYRV